MYCLTILEAAGSRLRCVSISFQRELSPWFLYRCLFPVSHMIFSPCTSRKTSLCIFFVLSGKAPVLLDQAPTLVVLFNLNYLSKGPISENSHTGGQGFTYEFWMDTIQSPSVTDEIRQGVLKAGCSSKVTQHCFQTRCLRYLGDSETCQSPFFGRGYQLAFIACSETVYPFLILLLTKHLERGRKHLGYGRGKMGNDEFCDYCRIPAYINKSYIIRSYHLCHLM